MTHFHDWLIPLLMVTIGTILAQLLTLAFPAHAAINPTYLSVVLCSIALFLAAEFGEFIWHYLQHRIPFLWELHKVHHSATYLTPFTSLRGHPLSRIGLHLSMGTFGGLPMGLFGFWYGFSPLDMLFLNACAGRLGAIASFESLKHSHFPMRLGWLETFLISPHMHQIHHSALEQHWDKNFGANLSIFDWLFGTAYRPKKGEEILCGLGTDEVRDHEDLAGVLVYPVVKMYKKAMERPASNELSESGADGAGSNAGVLAIAEPARYALHKIAQSIVQHPQRQQLVAEEAADR